MQQQNFGQPSQTANEQFLKWNQDGQIANFPDPLGYDGNVFNPEMMSQPPLQNPIPAPSTQLTRRPINRHLVATAQRQPYDDPWGAFGDDGMMDAQGMNGAMEENDNIELLEERAAIAKREAASKRKQIPPFVQKLSR